MPTQADEFLESVKKDSVVIDDDSKLADLMDKPKADIPKTPEVAPEKDEEEKPKTRRYKRLEKKNEEMAQMISEMNDRIKQLSELEKFGKDHPEVDPDEIAVYGTDEKGKLLKSFFEKKFGEIRQQTKEEVRAELESEQSRASEEDAKNSQTIDEAFETIEDRFNVDLSGSTKQSKDFRNGFIDFIESISPKNASGDITEYADFESGFEIYSKLASNTKPREVSDRQKSLADRSMTHSGSPVPESPKGPITFKSVTKYLDSLRNQ